MRSFTGGRGSGDRQRDRFSSNRGGRGGYNRGGRDDRQMFKTVCDNCGEKCEVPFRPSGDKPVYCSSCFEKLGDRGNRKPEGRSGYRDRKPQEDRYKDQFEAINTKLDKILDLLQPESTTEPASPAEVIMEAPTKKTEVKPTKKKTPAKKK